MNYDWLFSFVAFADKRNFTHAAELLGLSQPALHVQVKKLTDAVGTPLYVRHGRGLVLTPEGEQLATFGRSVMQQQSDMLGQLRGGTASPVVLAAGQGAFSYLLGPAIRRFPKKRWQLRLLTRRGPEAIRAVRDAKAQLGVAVVDQQLTDLQSVHLAGVGQVAVMQRQHRLAGRRRLTPGDLDNEPLVVAPAGSPHRVMLQQAMKMDGAALTAAVEATGWQLILEFAKHGMGIAVVNDFCPTPRGCVAIKVTGLPRTNYSLFFRETTNEAVLAMRQLIVDVTAGCPHRRK